MKLKTKQQFQKTTSRQLYIQPDRLLYPDEISYQRFSQQSFYQNRTSQQSKMSEQSYIQSQQRSSKLSNNSFSLNGSTQGIKKISKFGSMISSQMSQKLFRHKCNKINDQYLTCQCAKSFKQICRKYQCTDNCISFKYQNNPSLFTQIRDSVSSSETNSGIDEPYRDSEYFCEIITRKPEVKIQKTINCKCEAGGCRNNKCKCLKIGQFCDIYTCGCQQCRNLYQFVSLEQRISYSKKQRLSDGQMSIQQIRESRLSTQIQQQKEAQFQPFNFGNHFKRKSMQGQD